MPAHFAAPAPITLNNCNIYMSTSGAQQPGPYPFAAQQPGPSTFNALFAFPSSARGEARQGTPAQTAHIAEMPTSVPATPLAGRAGATPAPSASTRNDVESPAPRTPQRRPGQDIWDAAMALREEAKAPPSSTDGSSAFFDMARRPARGERQASTPSQQPRWPGARPLIRVVQANRQGQEAEHRLLPPPRPHAGVTIIPSSDNEAAPEEDQAVIEETRGVHTQPMCQ
jgi:hypothetical protein